LCAARSQSIAGLDTALVASDQPRKRKRHIHCVLHIMVSGVAASVAREPARKQPLEVVKGEPYLVKRRTWKRLAEQGVHSITNRDRIAHLYGVSDVVIVPAIVGHDFFLISHEAKPLNNTRGHKLRQRKKP
jgi:hypothetical protein